MTLPVIIVGAGPVGLTLALLLKQQNIPAVVYEAVAELKPLGVGINLLPHSVRVLHKLGLAQALDAMAVQTSALHYYNKYGQKIWQEPRGTAAGYEYPQYSIHRGEFQQLLSRQVKRELGDAAIKTGYRMSSWIDTENGVDVFFSTQTGTEAVSGRCLIAADGIKSTARKQLYPNEGLPIYGGRLLYRSTSVCDAFLDGKTMFMAGHQDCKFVAYPIAQLDNNKVLLNWIAELSAPNRDQSDQDWNAKVSPDLFSKHFAQWDFGWVNIPKIIAASEYAYEFPLSDRDPLPQWRQGNMTLVGDAAHPMYPIGSNGASQGILDAEVLTNALASKNSIPQAFERYERERRAITARIVLLNRQNGPEQVMQLAQQRAPQGFSDINSVISRTELEVIAGRYKQTAGFNVNKVNALSEDSGNQQSTRH